MTDLPEHHSWSSGSMAQHHIEVLTSVPSSGDGLTKSRPTRRSNTRTTVHSGELLDFIAGTQNGQDYNGHLEIFSNSIHLKLREMKELCQQLDGLRESAQELLASSLEDDRRSASDLAGRVAKLESSRDKVALIDGLRERLQVEREKVGDVQRRLNKVQTTIDAQKEREEVARRRVSWRLRMLWGSISAVVIIWLLATAGSDNGVGRRTIDPEHEPIKLTPPHLDGYNDVEEIAELEELLRDSTT